MALKKRRARSHTDGRGCMAYLGAQLGPSRILPPGVSAVRLLGTAVMDDMGLALSRSPLERLDFDNVALRKLPLDPSEEPGVRQVKGACFSRVKPQPLTRPRFVAVSHGALALLGLDAEEVMKDPLGPEYLSGSRVMPGSEPAAHCYCGHQFGQFAGQLGDGAACYLGEVKVPAGQDPELLRENPSGRWEIQVKGAGLTPYSRQADGRKVLRSSIREFLCSEVMFYLGIPTTRAGSVVTSDSKVIRDVYYSGNPRHERCSVVLRIAPTFLRFGSFEIFKPADESTGRQGPSYGRDEIRGQMMDYVIEMFYPEIQQNYPDRVERNVAFFREVMVRTARLVAQWQSVGFCHGVLNTDNMSILGLTLDYGPYGFMDRFDPDFICNASDNSGRYSYQAQPAICRWNLVKLAEALVPELPPDQAEAVIDEYMDLYNGFYLQNMRKKLGLLKKDEPEDEILITELLQTMHNTGADFTNTFRSLSQISCPTEGESEEEEVKKASDLLLEQCASLEELKAANKPTMDPRELAMLLSMAQSNPALFQMISDRMTVARQLDRLSRLKDLMETSQEELKTKQADDWTRWITRYRKRLARELEGQFDVRAMQEERVRVMDITNPRVILRNYIAQNAIEAAENGDFSEVQRVLKVLEKPFSSQPGLELPAWVGGGEATEQGEREEGEEREGACEKINMSKRVRPGYYRREVNKTSWEVPERYQDLKQVGTGAYGTVCSAVDTRSGSKVAIKKLYRPFQSELFAKRAYRELRLLKHMKHENVIGLLDVFTADLHVDKFHDFYLVMPFMGTDLGKLMKLQRLSQEKIQYLVYQMLKGLKYIHSAGIIHRDLKPGNLAINQDCELKILDFGLARQADSEMTGYVVTRWYRAPEVILSWMHYTQTDLDQLTEIMKVTGTPSQEFISKLDSEDAKSYIKSLPKVEKKDLQSVFSSTNPQAVSVLERMLLLDPESRVTAAEALTLPYFSEFREPEEETEAQPYDHSLDNTDLPLDQWKHYVMQSEAMMARMPQFPENT
ncbi:hypothetical protein L3Q82_007336 [Scortum barcoo]|uniref:Uncharacterized protein n=1 Tax=Scortum barcoo TaxID=214431 RepID=A0ACB8WSQ1_9TELE|nr:hypothetical protein L3Q82_007336 [Scortum barcoo]